MALSNNSKVILGRDIRNIVRSAVMAHAGWGNWYLGHMAGRDSGDIKAQELRTAATDLAIDIEAVCATAGVPVRLFDSRPRPAYAQSAPVVAPVDMSVIAAFAPTAPTAPTIEDMDDMDDTTETLPASPAAPHDDAPVHAAHAAPHAYEGRNAAMVLSEALAPVSAMFGTGSSVMNLIADAMKPLVDVAVLPPRVVTRETIKTVHVGALSTSLDGAAARVCNVREHRPGLVALGLRASDAGPWKRVLSEPVSLWDGTIAEGVPEIDPDHVWTAEALAFIVLAARHADNGGRNRNLTRALMYGPAGTGKTTTAEQFAARTGRPYYRIACDRNTEAQDLIGQRMPKAGGGTEFHDGALVAAMQVPGAVILIDEPSFLRPGVAATLQTTLDTGAAFLKEDGNRRVTMAPGVVVVAADNTNLAGDETGRYADTMAQNIALQDRFAWLVQMEYLAPSKEAGVLHAKTGVPLDVCNAMVGFAAQTRNHAANGQLTTGCSLRRLVAWALGVKAGIPSSRAFNAAVMNPSDPADRETLRGLAASSAPHGAIDNAMSGTGPDAKDATVQGATSTAQGAAAAALFGDVP